MHLVFVPHVAHYMCFHRVVARVDIEIGDSTDITSEKKRVSRCSSASDSVLFFTKEPQAAKNLECSNEQVDSSLARTSISGLGGRVDGIYSYTTFRGADAHLNCFEIESHPYHKIHLQESVAVIKNNMQESRQPQPGNPSDVSNLMDDWVRVCDTCGDVGREDLIAPCSKCTDGAQHTYCMRVKLDKVPEDDWMCEECMLRAGTEKLMQYKVEEAARRKGRLQSSKGSKLKYRSSYAMKIGKNGLSSTSSLSAKRHGVPLEAQSEKKARANDTSAVSLKSSKPCHNSLHSKDFSCKKSEGIKMKSINDIVYSFPQKSCDSQGKEKVPHATSSLSAKRHGVPLEAQSEKKARANETSAVSPKSSKPCHNSLHSKDFSCKKSEGIKMKSINDIVYSFPQKSCDSQGKEKVPHACGDREHVSTLVELGQKGRALETSLISHKASNSCNHYPLGGEPPSKKLGKVKLKAAGSVTSLKQSSYGAKKAKLPYCLGDGSPRSGSQTEIAHDKCSLLKSSSPKAANLKLEGWPAKAGSLQKEKVERNPDFHDDKKGKDPRTASESASLYSLNTEESNATCSEVLLVDAYELRDSAMCLLASDSGVAAEKSEKEITSCSEILFSGSSFCKLDAIESSGQLGHRLQANNHNTHKGPYCPNENNKNESQLAKHPTKAATAMSIYKLCTGPGSDERSRLRSLARVEAATLLQGGVIPEFDYAWLGKFQIHNNEGTARTCDGLQAHLSTCASPKVLEVVYRLPETIILEELPRSRMWPSQFMGRQVTEENIGLYFFAKDFDSYYTYYRGLMNHMTKNDLALKGNLDGVELLIFPSNILPEEIQRWNQMLFFWGVFKGQKANNSTNTPVLNSLKPENRDTVKIRAFDLNAYPEDEDEEAGVDESPQFDNMGGTGDGILLVGDSSNGKGGEAKPDCAVLDVNLPMQTRSATPENVAVGIEDKSASVSLAQPSTVIHLDQLDWQLAETLFLLSRDRF